MITARKLHFKLGEGNLVFLCENRWPAGKLGKSKNLWSGSFPLGTLTFTGISDKTYTSKTNPKTYIKSMSFALGSRRSPLTVFQNHKYLIWFVAAQLSLLCTAMVQTYRCLCWCSIHQHRMTIPRLQSIAPLFRSQHIDNGDNFLCCSCVMLMNNEQKTLFHRKSKWM